MNYHGIIEIEALKNKNILSKFKIIHHYTEKHQDEEPSLWNISIVLTDTDNINFLLKELSNSMKSEWYSLIWNLDFVYVVFQKKIFKIKNKTPWDKKEFDEVIEYGASQNIRKRYFDNLRKSMKIN